MTTEQQMILNNDLQDRWKKCIRETCSMYKLVYDNMEFIERLTKEVTRIAIDFANDFSKCLNKFLTSMSDVLNGNKKEE